MSRDLAFASAFPFRIAVPDQLRSFEIDQQQDTPFYIPVVQAGSPPKRSSALHQKPQVIIFLNDHNHQAKGKT